MTEFCRDEPITCQWTILDLLSREWADSSSRTLYRYRGQQPHVEVWWEGGDHGRGAPTINNYFVDPHVVQLLVNLGCLAGVPKWGYTEKNELWITEHGTRVLDEKRDALSAGVPLHDRFPRATRWYAEFRKRR